MVHKRQLYTSKTNVKYVATNCIKIIDSLTSINSSMFQDSYHILEVKSGGINTFIVFMSIKHSWRNLKTHRRWCGGNGRVLLGSPVGGRVDAGPQLLPPGPTTVFLMKPHVPHQWVSVMGLRWMSVSAWAPKDSPWALQIFLMAVMLSETLPSQPFFPSLPSSQVSDSASSFHL